jgi:hypothetical protein
MVGWCANCRVEADLGPRFYSWRGSLCRCLTSSEWNVEGGRQRVAVAGLSLAFSSFFLFVFGYFDGILG